jgi:hypothetical protein
MRTGNCQRWPTRHAIADRAVNLGPCEVEDNGPAWDNRRSGGPWPTHDRIRADCLTKRAKTAGLAGSVRSSYLRAVRVFVNALERLNYGVDSPLSAAGIRRGSLLTSLPWAQCRWFESSRPAHARARGTGLVAARRPTSPGVACCAMDAAEPRTVVAQSAGSV